MDTKNLFLIFFVRLFLILFLGLNKSIPAINFSISKALSRQNYSASFSSVNEKHFFIKNRISIEIQEHNPIYKINDDYYRFETLPHYNKKGLSIVSNEAMKFLNILESYSNNKKKLNNNKLEKKKNSKIQKKPLSLFSKKDVPFLNIDNKSKKIDVIFLDPGHGGRDPGALSYGFKEKDLTLLATKELGNILKEKTSKTKIVFTRFKDEYLSLEARCHLANNQLKKGENGIFISTHLNFWFDPETSGFEVYYLSHQTKSINARIFSLVKNENFDLNKSDVDSLSEFEKIFGRLEVIQYQRESQLMANYIADHLLGHAIGYSGNRGVKSELFYVLKGAIMPSVLIELGFISNKKDLDYLSNKEKREKILLLISKGIIKYLKEFNKTDGFKDNLLE